MFLDDILKRNEEYARGRAAAPLPPPETLHLVVVACYDPRLDPLLGPALGVDHGEAFLLRAAGAYVAPVGGIIRSLAMAVYMFGAREVAVVGHTSCRMASFANASFIESFRARGVRREAFGDEDLRVWAGAIPDPRSGVRISVASILSAPFLPKDLAVAGLVLDDTTGALEVVHRPGDPVSALGIAAASIAASPSALAGKTFAQTSEPVPAGTTFAKEAGPAPAARGARQRESAREAAREAPARGAVAATRGREEPEEEAEIAPPDGRTPPPEARGAGDPTQELLHSVREIRTFVKKLEESAFWRHELKRIRADLAREQNPMARLAILEGFVRKASGQWKEVSVAFDRLKRETASTRRSLDREQLVELFRRTTGQG